jgi:hypothetical protein
MTIPDLAKLRAALAHMKAEDYKALEALYPVGAEFADEMESAVSELESLRADNEARTVPRRWRVMSALDEEDRDAVRALVGALPKCALCREPATAKIGIGVYCDRCAGGVHQQAEPGYEETRRPLLLTYTAELRTLIDRMKAWTS